MKVTLTCLQRRLAGRATLPLLTLVLLMAVLAVRTFYLPYYHSSSSSSLASLVRSHQPSRGVLDSALSLLAPRGAAFQQGLGMEKERAEGGGGGGSGGEGGGGRWFNGPNCSVLEVLGRPDPSVQEAYDPALVCGPRARDRDVVCSTFFSQIGLHDDSDCLRPYDDNYVPRIVYFVIFGDYVFKFWHYVSIMAAKRHVSASALYLIGDAHPTGYWWQRVLRDCKGVRFVYRARPPAIGGQPVKFRHHLSDLVRLQVLLLNGGIYLDADMVMVRDPGPILQHDITLGLIENGTGMGNAFIAARRNSPFVREWYEHYNAYNRTQFYANSLHVPRDMWHRHPGRVHMESQRLYRPNWFEADKLFKGWDYDWRQNYAVHVWTNGNPVPRSEEDIQTANTTVAQVFRNALYGDPAPRKGGGGGGVVG